MRLSSVLVTSSCALCCAYSEASTTTSADTTQAVEASRFIVRQRTARSVARAHAVLELGEANYLLYSFQM